MNTRDSNRQPLFARLRPLLIGLCVGVLCGTLLLLISALLIRSVDIPIGAATPLAVTAAAGGAFAGGWTAARIAGCRGLVWGVLCGGLLTLILLLAGLVRAGGIDPGFAAVKTAVLTLSGGLGGILGVGKTR